MASTTDTARALAYDRAGPRGERPLLLLHAGVADRRMWDPQWDSLTRSHDVVRLDLRGFGESTERPVGDLSHVEDVLATLATLDVDGCHVVGASMGAGVAVELALTRPALVASLLLSAPGGSLIPAMTPALRAFADAESAATESGDLDAAVEANLAAWVDGAGRGPGVVDPAVRSLVADMQRRAFELTADWDDVEEAELEPDALDRLGEIGVPTLVLVGGHDLDAIHEAADRVTEGVSRVRRIDWPDTAHLPSLERPADFLVLVEEWLATIA